MFDFLIYTTLTTSKIEYYFRSTAGNPHMLCRGQTSVIGRFSTAQMDRAPNPTTPTVCSRVNCTLNICFLWVFFGLYVQILYSYPAPPSTSFGALSCLMIKFPGVKKWGSHHSLIGLCQNLIRLAVTAPIFKIFPLSPHPLPEPPPPSKVPWESCPHLSSHLHFL